MNPVGDVAHWDVGFWPARKQHLEDLPAHLAVTTADAIDGAACASGQPGHAHRLFPIGRARTSERQQVVERHTQLVAKVGAEVRRNELRWESIESCLNGRVGREHVAGPRCRQRDLERLSTLHHEIARPLDGDERGMSFVEMAHLGTMSRRAQQTPSSDAERHFLEQARFRAAAVKLPGDAAIGGGVLGVVAVQEIEVNAADARLPPSQPHGSPRPRQRHA